VKEGVDACWNAQLEERGVPGDLDVYVYLLQLFANTISVAQGKRVHHHMLQNKVEYTLLLAGKLEAMYAMWQSHSIKCASRISISKPPTSRLPLPSQSSKLNKCILSLHRFPVTL